MTKDALPPDSGAVFSLCLKRLMSWRTPPNWSTADWLEEITSVGLVTVCQAESEFEPSRNVPWVAFLYQRILARVFTRYRQEWAYALHAAPEINEEPAHLVPKADAQFPAETRHESVRAIIDLLPAPDRRLVALLFWQEHTESQIAQSLGITQSAVNKRKQLLLGRLRGRLESAGIASRINQGGELPRRARHRKVTQDRS